MIAVKITMSAREEKQKELVQTLLSMIEPTGNEAGCMGYAVFCDVEEKDRFIVMEEWESRENLDDHIRSHRFGVLLGSMTLLCGQSNIQINTVSQSEGMEAIDAVRNKKS